MRIKSKRGDKKLPIKGYAIFKDQKTNIQIVKVIEYKSCGEPPL